MGAPAAGQIAAPMGEGLRATGDPRQITTFNPEGVSSGLAPWLRQSTTPLSPMDRGNRPQLGESQAEKLAQQRALADEMRSRGAAAAEKAKHGSSAVTSDDYEAAPPEYQYYGDSMFGMLPKDYKAPQDTGPQEWTDRDYDFSGVDKGWDKYEADYQKWADPNTYRTAEGISDWDSYAKAFQRQQLDSLMGEKGGIIHALESDARDPYGYGSDYGRWYDQAHGKGALAREANKYARGMLSHDPAFEGYRKGYGDIDWNDAAQVEDWMRRANMGGTRTANEQSRISQNARTDMTEAALMTAIGAGIGGMAGIGGLGSAWSNANTLASGASQFG